MASARLECDAYPLMIAVGENTAAGTLREKRGPFDERMPYPLEHGAAAGMLEEDLEIQESSSALGFVDQSSDHGWAVVVALTHREVLARAGRRRGGPG